MTFDFSAVTSTRAHHVVGHESFPHANRVGLAQVATTADVDCGAGVEVRLGRRLRDHLVAGNVGATGRGGEVGSGGTGSGGTGSGGKAGNVGTGGRPGTGGSTAAGGSNSGGVSSAGGSNAQGGAHGTGGSTTDPLSPTESGCSCVLGRVQGRSASAVAILLALVGLAWRTRRSR